MVLAQFKLYINEKQRGVYNISLPKHSIVKKEIDIYQNKIFRMFPTTITVG